MNRRLFTTIRCDGQFAALENFDNHLPVIELNQNYKTIHPLLSQNSCIKEGEGALTLNFGRLEGRLFEGVTYLREDARYLREVSTFRS